MTARALRLTLPAGDLPALKARVRALAENLPGTYQMLDAQERVLYVGKAKALRARLLSYFRAQYPEDKASRILHAAHDIRWQYAPSEFAAFLAELRQIRAHRPRFNFQMNYVRRTVLVKVSAGAAPRVTVGGGLLADDARAYGPFRSMGRAREAIRVLNDLLQLRDCAAAMPIVYAGQGDLFDAPRTAACHRHEIGTCLGPCAGFVAEWDYARRVGTAVAFLEGRTIQPIDRAIAIMTSAAERGEYEIATRHRERFEALEWLLAATSHARAVIDGLSFVYRDPGVKGDDRVYLIRRGRIRATYPYPSTPLEREAFRAVVREELQRPESAPGPLPIDGIDEILLVMSWFRRHADALRRTTAFETWM